MSTPNIPTPQDQALILQTATTKTASFNSTALDLGAGFAPGGLGTPMAAIVHVTALDLASENEVYSFVLQDSDDNSSFAAIGAAVSAAAVGAYAAKGHVTRRYVRLALTASGTTPSITYKAWLNPLP